MFLLAAFLPLVILLIDVLLGGVGQSTPHETHLRYLNVLLNVLEHLSLFGCVLLPFLLHRALYSIPTLCSRLLFFILFLDLLLGCELLSSLPVQELARRHGSFLSQYSALHVLA